MSIELPSLTEMAFYFPHSAIEKERVLGVIKSVIAVKVS
jgi:hypothetical protein